MPAELNDTKAALRREVRTRLKAMTAPERAIASEQARALLQRQAVWQRARSILFFAPLPEELDLWPLLETALAAGKTVGLPRFTPETGRYLVCQIRDCARDLRCGQFGIREPIESCITLGPSLDLLLVPGIAFDLQGHRLGRGKGHYDQLLVTLRGTTCGVGFDEQIVPRVPIEAHDVRLNCVLTPTRWIEAVTERVNQ